MFIEVKLSGEVKEFENKNEYIFKDNENKEYIIKYPYIFGEPYTYCSAILRKSKILGEYVVLIK